MRTSLHHLTKAAAPGRCTCSWAAIAVCETVDPRGARPRPSDTRRRRWSTGAGRFRPTTTSVGRPARGGLSGNARRRAYPWRQPASPVAGGGGLRAPAGKFPGVGHPDLDKLATHGLTLPGRWLGSGVLPAKMALARDGLTVICPQGGAITHHPGRRSPVPHPCGPTEPPPDAHAARFWPAAGHG